MNAAAPAPADFVQATENYHNGSDSDSNLDDDDASDEFYQPVSAVDSEEEDENDSVPIHSHQLQPLPNGVAVHQVETGISSLHLNGVVERNDHSISSEDEEEEEVVASDSEIMRAFREDENRRNAPLTAENATRVREAMRGISFAGVPPPWAGRIPESNWMDRLRGLGQSSRS